MELVQDFEEESKNKNKQQLDEEEKICEDFIPINIRFLGEKRQINHFHQDLNCSFVKEVHSPPPEHTT